MRPRQVVFPLASVYERHGIEFRQGWAREIHPEGDASGPDPYVTVELNVGGTERIRYDFLVNAAGPRLRFDKTEGLGPEADSLSVCRPEHAIGASAALDEATERDVPRRAAAVPGPPSAAGPSCGDHGAKETVPSAR